MSRLLLVHPILGRIWEPAAIRRSLSLPGRPVKRRQPGEVGVLIACQFRQDALVWHSITHNERVDVGAALQANLVYGTAGTTANGVTTALAIASASLTVTKTDLSLGSASGGVTTNEFTTIGLARVAATLGSYTAPSSLGGAFSQVITKTMTATGSGTAFGSGLFDKVVVSGSNLYVEANYSSTAVLVTNDTLDTTWTVSD